MEVSNTAVTLWAQRLTFMIKTWQAVSSLRSSLPGPMVQEWFQNANLFVSCCFSTASFVDACHDNVPRDGVDACQMAAEVACSRCKSWDGTLNFYFEVCVLSKKWDMFTRTGCTCCVHWKYQIHSKNHPFVPAVASQGMQRSTEGAAERPDRFDLPGMGIIIIDPAFNMDVLKKWFTYVTMLVRLWMDWCQFFDMCSSFC